MSDRTPSRCSPGGERAFCIQSATIGSREYDLRTDIFDAWLRDLRDAKGKARINARIISAQVGNFGDCKPVGEGVSEMRVDVGPGYRVYFMRSGLAIYMLLAGGDKSTQAKDIKRAIALANELRGMR